MLRFDRVVSIDRQPYFGESLWLSAVLLSFRIFVVSWLFSLVLLHHSLIVQKTAVLVIRAEVDLRIPTTIEYFLVVMSADFY